MVRKVNMKKDGKNHPESMRVPASSCRISYVDSRPPFWPQGSKRAAVVRVNQNLSSTIEQRWELDEYTRATCQEPKRVSSMEDRAWEAIIAGYITHVQTYLNRSLLSFGGQVIVSRSRPPFHRRSHLPFPTTRRCRQEVSAARGCSDCDFLS